MFQAKSALLKVTLSVGSVFTGSPAVASLNTGSGVPKPGRATKKDKGPRKPTTYVVQKGDTPGGIAQQLLGRASRWTEIQKANPDMKPNNLQIGQTLLIPGDRPAAIRTSKKKNSTQTAETSTPFEQTGYKAGKFFKFQAVRVDGKFVMEQKTAEAFVKMRAAAKAQGVTLTISDAFRSYAEQERLYNKWIRYNAYKEGRGPKAPRANLAAKPGRSKHHSGIALDIRVQATRRSAAYRWLAFNADKFGFMRTVNRNDELHHWEYKPDEAAKRAKEGTLILRRDPNLKLRPTGKREMVC